MLIGYYDYALLCVLVIYMPNNNSVLTTNSINISKRSLQLYDRLKWCSCIMLTQVMQFVFKNILWLLTGISTYSCIYRYSTR